MKLNIFHIWIQARVKKSPKKLIHKNILNNIDKWIDLNPDLQINRYILDKEEGYNYIWCKDSYFLANSFRKQSYYHYKSDILRLILLYHEGGFYIDIDQEPLIPLVEMGYHQDLDLILVKSNGNQLPNGFIWAKKENGYIKSCIKLMKNNYRNGDIYHKYDLAQGPLIMYQAFLEYFDLDKIPEQGYHEINGMKILLLYEKMGKKVHSPILSEEEAGWASFQMFNKDQAVMNSRYISYYRDRLNQDMNNLVNIPYTDFSKFGLHNFTYFKPDNTNDKNINNISNTDQKSNEKYTDYSNTVYVYLDKILEKNGWHPINDWACAYFIYHDDPIISNNIWKRGDTVITKVTKFSENNYIDYFRNKFLFYTHLHSRLDIAILNYLPPTYTSWDKVDKNYDGCDWILKNRTSDTIWSYSKVEHLENFASKLHIMNQHIIYKEISPVSTQLGYKVLYSVYLLFYNDKWYFYNDYLGFFSSTKKIISTKSFMKKLELVFLGEESENYISTMEILRKVSYRLIKPFDDPDIINPDNYISFNYKNYILLRMDYLISENTPKLLEISTDPLIGTDDIDLYLKNNKVCERFYTRLFNDFYNVVIKYKTNEKKDYMTNMNMTNKNNHTNCNFSII